MRILHVNQDRGVGPQKQKGAAVHVRAMREAFRALGAEVVELDEHDAARLAAALERVGPVDLVYERHALATPLPARFAEARGVPYALEVNAPLSEEATRWRAESTPAEAAEAENLARADLALCVSAAVAEYATALGAASESVVVRANGVDARRFRPRTDDALRDELVPRGRVALGFHGRLRPWHGISRLVDAALAALAAGADLHLVFVGVGGDDPELARLPAERLTIVPWVDHDDVARHVACFDVLPLTHPPDLPFYFSPLKLAEAMAAGVVPVVPRLGDLEEVVRDGWSGRVYAPEDPAALVRVLVELAASGEERSLLGANARAAATANSWDAIARFVLQRVGLDPALER